MDFLNQTFAQVSDLFRSMTPGARITAGLLLVLVVISLGYLFAYQVSSSDEYLFGGEPFPRQYLDNMELVLGAAGVSCETDKGRIRVGRGQKEKAMGALAAADAMPPQWGKSFAEAMSTESIFTSSDQRALSTKIATQKTLSTWVEAMPDIQRAEVVYNCKTQPGFRKTSLNTASVSVVPLPGRELNQERATTIRNMIARAISGMKPDDVTVTDLTNSRSFHGGLDGGNGTMGARYGELKRQYERDWKEKILVSLAHVPGVTVSPNVELASVRSHRTRTVTPDPKGTARRTIEKSTERSREEAGPAGRPGFKANQPNALPAVAGKGSSDTESESETVEDVIVGGKEEETETVPMTPTRVTAAIGVPSSYFEKIWLKQNPPAEGEEQKKPDPSQLTTIQTQETDKIQKLVAQLLPQVEGVADPTELVQVTAFPDLPQTEIPSPPMTETVMVWLSQYWSTLGMLGLAAFSLVMLRSMVRSAPVEAPAPKAATAAATNGEGEEGQPTVFQPRLSRFSKGGASLRDELSELVKEDAEAAANILRTWIGETSRKS